MEILKELAVSVVIPCYKTGMRVERLTQEIKNALSNAFDDSFEIIFVVDGSPDDTWDLVVSEAAKNSFVKGINLMRNYGQQSALLAGIREASGNVIVTMDDDFQHNPSDIPLLIAALCENADIVYGVPTNEEHSFFRNMTSNFYRSWFSLFVKTEGVKYRSSFRAFKSEISKNFANTNDMFETLDVMLLWNSNKVVSVPININKRLDGKSNYKLKSLIQVALNEVTGYSILPLRIVSLFGCLIFGFSFILSITFAVQYFLGIITLDGFPTIVILISMFSGVQLLSLGVIGEYLGRLHFRSMGNPRYVIKNII